jgi:hypothetical protein
MHCATQIRTYIRHSLYNTIVQYSNLRESYITDDGPVWPKHVAEFTWNREVKHDPTNNLWRCIEDNIVTCMSDYKRGVGW